MITKDNDIISEIAKFNKVLLDFVSDYTEKNEKNLTKEVSFNIMSFIESLTKK